MSCHRDRRPLHLLDSFLVYLTRTYSVTVWFTLLSIHSFIGLFVYLSLVCSFTGLIPSFIGSLPQLLIQSFIGSFICLCVDSLIHSLVHSLFFHPSIHWLTHSFLGSLIHLQIYIEYLQVIEASGGANLVTAPHSDHPTIEFCSG